MHLAKILKIICELIKEKKNANETHFSNVPSMKNIFCQKYSWNNNNKKKFQVINVPKL